MRKLNSVLASLARDKSQWRELLRPRPATTPTAPELRLPRRLREVTGFGSNPGNLRMFDHAPAARGPRPALVVALHGCTQTAAAYDHGAGWSTLAERHGFVVLAPQQEKANNPNNCFNWFQPGDTARGRGEAMSIRQMITRAIADHHVDEGRVFITGLSAGGAMACVMLATYPEVFAAGSIVAGLPFGAAGNVQEALECMLRGPRHTGDELAGLVRQASPHDGPWPRISVWHGTGDKTVLPQNAGALVAQWAGVHALTATATLETVSPALHHRQWSDARGEPLVEEYLVTGMGHGVPLAAGSFGAPGPYFLDVGISSTERIAAFWGLVEQPLEIMATPLRDDARGAAVVAEEVSVPVPWPPVSSGVAASRAADDSRATAAVEPAEGKGAAPRGFDVGATIEKALRSAGLMR